MGFIDNIKGNNQFPIIFIGSGITQRYFKNSPTWEGLLKSIWIELFDEEEFYAKNYELQQETQDEFSTYLKLADYLEEEIDKAFWNRQLNIEGLTLKEVYEKKLSPFKELIAKKFMKLELREGFEDEIRWFSQMLSKARIIITTNYDVFIEECLRSVSTGIKVNVGNKGLFTKSTDYGELYKIHGSITESSTIAITSKDYEGNSEKSSIVNAKILSNLVEAPIIFLGYSLTDENIKKLLTDFARNSPYDIQESANKIGVVEYTPNQVEIVDVISSLSDLSVHYTQIKTDNYLEIYKKLAAIDQGFLPSELSRYERAFRKIIEVKGEDKQLKTVLTTYLDLSKLSDKEIREKNIVVAFGDGHYIYKFPDMITYLREYFNDNSEMPIEIIAGFISQQLPQSYFPFKKHTVGIEKYIERKSLSANVFDRLKKHLVKEADFDYERFRIDLRGRISKTHLPKLENCKSISDVIILENVPMQLKYFYIASHLEEFNLQDIQQFIMDTLKTVTEISTDLRKLLKMYDHFIN